MAYLRSRQKRIDAGLCKDCGSPRADSRSKIMCQKCLKRQNKRGLINQRKKSKKIESDWDNGKQICTTCGKDSDNIGFKSCKKCLSYALNHRIKHKERRDKHKKENKLCSQCSNPAMKKRCKKCWTRRLLAGHGINIDLWEDYWKLLEKQEFKCFYSGLELIPEVNASIDHVTPKSKGGANDISNIVWCDLSLNTFKWTNDYESLIKLCRLLILNHEKKEEQKNEQKITEQNYEI